MFLIIILYYMYAFGQDHFCSLLIPQVFAKKEKNKNTIVFLLVNLLFMIIPFGSSIMHGFSEPAFRWFQFSLFVNLTLILPYLDENKLINRKCLFMSVLFISLILLFGTPLLGILNNIPFQKYSREKFNINYFTLFMDRLFCLVKRKKMDIYHFHFL